MKLIEIAQRISKHLARFENNPAINRNRAGGTTHYFNARAYQAGRYVMVVYVSYQSVSALTRDDAIAYLDWLDRGNVGKHFQVPSDSVR